jgi:16S rRNA (cytidine1402-2'-O)-methyltransferase
VYRGTLGELAERAGSDADLARGEIVIVVAGALQTDAAADAARAAERVLGILLTELPVSQAARLASQLTGQRRGELYEHALALQPPSAPTQE